MAKSKVAAVSIKLPEAGTKKIWVIKQAPEHFAHRREDLREIRRQLHKEAGIDELSEEFKALTPAEKAGKSIYTLTRGPDHLHYVAG